MGIRQLSRVIGDQAPRAATEHVIKEYFGRRIAIDASMSIYQFLIAVRSEGQTLTNDLGETTSHLMGLFYRTIRMLENGLKPVYVFDGKPPTLKSAELAKRGERRVEAMKEHSDATEVGDLNAMEKFAKRTVKVTPKHNEECKRLLSLMGVPFVQAPGEAEAQCADLAKRGLVFGVGSEDMDTLTFGAPVLLRHLTFSEARKMPIVEIQLEKVLCGLKVDMNQFIDLCILLGCDYCGTVKGVGPAKAYSLIQEHGSIEAALKEGIDATKVDSEWAFAEARRLFLHPLVLESNDPQLENLKWTCPPDPEALVAFMCNQHGFNEKRIRQSVEKLCKLSGASTQKRMDDFFKSIPVEKAADNEATKKERGGGGGEGGKTAALGGLTKAGMAKKRLKNK